MARQKKIQDRNILGSIPSRGKNNIKNIILFLVGCFGACDTLIWKHVAKNNHNMLGLASLDVERSLPKIVSNGDLSWNPAKEHQEFFVRVSI